MVRKSFSKATIAKIIARGIDGKVLRGHRRKLKTKVKFVSNTGSSTAINTLARQKGSLMTKTNVLRLKTQNPFPLKLFCKLNYSNTEILTATGGNVATATAYRLNSVYDPYYPVGGTQPYQYDQLTPIYGTYKVHGAKVKIIFHDPSHDGLMVGYRVRPSTNSTVTGGQNVRILATMANTSIKPLNDSGSQQAVFTGYVKMQDVFGRTRQQYNSEANFASAVTTNPSAGDALLDIFVIDMNNNMDRTVKMTVSIQYLCQFFDYISPAES